MKLEETKFIHLEFKKINMRGVTMLFLMSFLSVTAFGQDIIGDWNGILNVQGTQLTLVLHINETEEGLTSTLDSPDQGANGIPVTKITFENNELYFEIGAINAQYKGNLEEGKFTGTFTQMGFEFPLDLSREKAEKKPIVRPQEPAEPYPYHTEDVKFKNESAGIELAGTFTRPQKKGKYPVVILITGSGPQDRNEELMGHKPFLVIADHFTRNGIAVLRYDDRGVGESTGKHDNATSADLATDVDAAVAYLRTRKDINKKKIGLVGHSEGGLIAPMVAANNKSVAYIVLMAGPGMVGHELLKMQTELIVRSTGESEDVIQETTAFNEGIYKIIVENEGRDVIREKVSQYMEENTSDYILSQKPPQLTKEEFSNILLEQRISKWMIYFLKYNPDDNLSKVKCPVLAINGDKDLQVPAKENIEGIAASLKKGGNTNVTTKIFPDMNHLFQECETGAITEYSTIEQTFSPIALKTMSDWILKIVE